MIELPISRRVIGCAFTVSNALGVGFLESFYANALCIELADQGIQFVREASLQVVYRDRIVGNFAADLVVDGRLLVELKALRQLSSDHESHELPEGIWVGSRAAAQFRRSEAGDTASGLAA